MKPATQALSISRSHHSPFFCLPVQTADPKTLFSTQAADLLTRQPAPTALLSKPQLSSSYSSKPSPTRTAVSPPFLSIAMPTQPMLFCFQTSKQQARITQHLMLSPSTHMWCFHQSKLSISVTTSVFLSLVDTRCFPHSATSSYIAINTNRSFLQSLIISHPFSATLN